VRLDLPIEILTVDHVAMATWDVSNMVRLLTEVLGGEYVDGGDDQGAGFRWLQFRLPGGKIEVLEPLHREGFLYRFLTRRGEGLHHVTIYVSDLAEAVPKLKAAGYEPVDVNLANEFWKEAFLHPRDTSGVLIQLAQTPLPDGGYDPPLALEDALADRPNLRPD
jgi:methylmalonyl-CoA epimerase